MDELEPGSIRDKGRWQTLLDHGVSITVFSCPDCGKIFRASSVISADGRFAASCYACKWSDDVILKGWNP